MSLVLLIAAVIAFAIAWLHEVSVLTVDNPGAFVIGGLLLFAASFLPLPAWPRR